MERTSCPGQSERSFGYGDVRRIKGINHLLSVYMCIYTYMHVFNMSRKVSMNVCLFLDSQFWNTLTCFMLLGVNISTTYLRLFQFLVDPNIEPLEDKNFESQSYCTPRYTLTFFWDPQGNTRNIGISIQENKAWSCQASPHVDRSARPAKFLQSFIVVYMETGKTIENHSFSKPDATLCVSVFVQSNHIHVQKPVGV